MDSKTKQEIALARFAVIAPIVSGNYDESKGKMAYYRQASQTQHAGYDGKMHMYTEHTIKNWDRRYRLYGFEGLLPKDRSDLGRSRVLDEDLKRRIEYIKDNNPRCPAAEIYRKLVEEGVIRRDEVSESTVSRYISRYREKQKYTDAKDMRRYERPHINEIWCGDTCAGPYFTDADGRKHKIYVIALIDDASRFIVGAEVFLNDNFVNLMQVLRSAVAKYGRPSMLNFDNGSSFKNKQMELLAARIGTCINYCQPYTPTSKAKIERWFRTLRDHWMSMLHMKDYNLLSQIQDELNIYVAKYNTTPHSSLDGKTPQDRFFEESDLIKRIPAEKLDRDFLLEIERRVSADCVISIDCTEYEVDCRFAKQRITLRYSPDFSRVYVVDPAGTLTPIRFLNKHENASVKRDKVRLSGGGDPS